MNSSKSLSWLRGKPDAITIGEDKTSTLHSRNMTQTLKAMLKENSPPQREAVCCGDMIKYQRENE